VNHSLKKECLYLYAIKNYPVFTGVATQNNQVRILILLPESRRQFDLLLWKRKGYIKREQFWISVYASVTCKIL